MTAESQNFGAVLNKLAVEQNVIRPYVDQIQTDLVSAMSDTATKERRPVGASDDPRHPAAQACGAT